MKSIYDIIFLAVFNDGKKYKSKEPQKNKSVMVENSILELVKDLKE